MLPAVVLPGFQKIVKKRSRLLHCMACSKPVFLDDRGMGRGGCSDRLHPRADHHDDAVGVQCPGGVEHPAQHRFARDLVQNLRAVRLHAGAHACGQNHHSKTI